MIVSVTPTRSPRASIRGARPASTSSISQADSQPAYRSATPAALTSIPTAGMSLSAMPATGPPPTIPLMPTTRSRRAPTASRTPGTARMGAIETTGFEGQHTIASASTIASRTPGAGRAADAPSYRTPFTGSSARRRTQ